MKNLKSTFFFLIAICHCICHSQNWFVSFSLCRVRAPASQLVSQPTKSTKLICFVFRFEFTFDIRSYHGNAGAYSSMCWCLCAAPKWRWLNCLHVSWSRYIFFYYFFFSSSFFFFSFRAVVLLIYDLKW